MKGECLMKKRLIMICMAFMIAALSAPALAADSVRTVDAQLRADFSIVVDGEEVYFKTSNGAAIYPILYNGTTYLPLRAIGELMGKNVNWDEQNKVISIGGVRESASSNRANSNIGRKDIYVQERPDFTIVVDNNEKKFYASTGQRLYPILYNGSTYLPLRAIGELMGKSVDWDDRNKVVKLTGKYTVTDADSFNSEKEEIDHGYIGTESAKDIAVDFVNLRQKDVTFLRAELDYEDGRWVYDVEFYTDDKEYDITINAKTGKILDYDYEIDNWKRPSTSSDGKDIGMDQAKKIALKHAGLKERDVTFIKAQLDYDDGQKVYEIEFRVNKVEYEYDIDAGTGNILQYDKDYDEDYDDLKF